MTLLFILLAIGVLGLTVAVALGRIGGGLQAPTSSLPSDGAADQESLVVALDEARFAPALRGYRMDQVDALLDRVSGELRRRDAEIERLRTMLAEADLVGLPSEIGDFVDDGDG